MACKLEWARQCCGFPQWCDRQRYVWNSGAAGQHAAGL
jgi:hypothetical protein